jgi:hypothetical protein
MHWHMGVATVPAAHVAALALALLDAQLLGDCR